MATRLKALLDCLLLIWRSAVRIQAKEVKHLVHLSVAVMAECHIQSVEPSLRVSFLGRVKALVYRPL